MTHIERMQDELDELKAKIINAIKFLKKEEKDRKVLDDIQFDGLKSQLDAMQNYQIILHSRILYDTEKLK